VKRVLGGLLAADVISTLGTEMTSVALPWLVLLSTGSPARTGGVLAAEFVGLTVLGLLGGRAAARLGSRRTMLSADAARTVLMGLIGLWAGLGRPPYVLLLVVAFLVGGFFPAYSSSQRLVAADALGDDEGRLTRFNGLANAVNESASFLGPALGGVLVAALGAPHVLLLDAASYLCAFALIAALVPRPTITTKSTVDDGVRAGLRYLWTEPALRLEVAGLGLVEIGFAAMMASLPVLALRSGGGASAAGWLVGAYGAGSVLGGLLATRSPTKAGNGAVIAMAVVAAALAIPSPLWIEGVTVGLLGITFGLYFPRFFAAVTAGTPAPLRPTVLTAVNVLISAPGPLGFLGAGLLNQYGPGRAAGLVLVAAMIVPGTLAVLAARRLRPPQGTPAAPASAG
jgi:predicted MFS family arabinose efflux permease